MSFLIYSPTSNDPSPNKVTHIPRCTCCSVLIGEWVTTDLLVKPQALFNLSASCLELVPFASSWEINEMWLLLNMSPRQSLPRWWCGYAEAQQCCWGGRHGPEPCEFARPSSKSPKGQTTERRCGSCLALIFCPTFCCLHVFGLMGKWTKRRGGLEAWSPWKCTEHVRREQASKSPGFILALLISAK